MSFNSTLMTNVTVAAAARIGGPLATLSIFVIRFAPICFLDHVPLTGKQLLPDMFHVHRSFSKKGPFLNKGDIDYMDCRKSDGSKMLGFLATKSRSVKCFSIQPGLFEIEDTYKILCNQLLKNLGFA